MADKAALLAYQRDVLSLTDEQITSLTVDQRIAINGQFLQARTGNSFLSPLHSLNFRLTI